MSVAQVMDALQAEAGGRGAGEAARPFPEVSIDTRSLRPGQCYLAIAGRRHDGHEFIEQALQAGASAIVQSRPAVDPAAWPGRMFLKVSDTTQALQNLAAFARRKWGGRLVAVTGSMGKTTTRSFTASLLARRYRVHESPGNLNNEIGVPLSLLQLSDFHEAAVLELGMNHPGEIARLGRICQPDAVILTNVAAVHLEFFSSLEEIAEAKGEILQYLSPGGQLFFNADDARLVRLADRFAGTKVTFGIDAPCDFRVEHYEFQAPDRMRFRISHPDGSFEGQVPFCGRAFLYNLAAAVAVGCTLGLSAAEAAEAVVELRPQPMRGQVLELKGPAGPITVWDDSYNSNPGALDSLLETVAEMSGYPRKILVLGEMLELGPRSAQLHREAGRRVLRAGAGMLLTVGPQAAALRDGALEVGYPQEQTAQFEDSEAAADYLKDHLRAGDLVVVKGSRGVRMERVIHRLQECGALTEERSQT